jgi:hypothetical protein
LLFAAINDNTNNNTINIATDSATGIIRGSITTGGVLQTSGVTSGTASANTTFKAALGYATNNVAISGNGGISGVDTSVTLPTVSQLNLGTRASAQLPINGYLRRITYYPRRLSNAELVSITS